MIVTPIAAAVLFWSYVEAEIALTYYIVKPEEVLIVEHEDENIIREAMKDGDVFVQSGSAFSSMMEEPRKAAACAHGPVSKKPNMSLEVAIWADFKVKRKEDGYGGGFEFVNKDDAFVGREMEAMLVLILDLQKQNRTLS
ncbi:hypothetical protein AAG906_022890 [Vitis piasezkii]